MTRKLNLFIQGLFLGCAFLFLNWGTPWAQQESTNRLHTPPDLQWPRQIDLPKATILIYQPQLEKFHENIIESRFAASVKTPQMEEPVFGAVWTKAHVEIDRDSRMVRLISIETVRSRFPNATPDQEKQFAAILKEQIPQWNLPLSLDRLIAGLEVTEKRQGIEEQFSDSPPNIIHVQEPAVLVMLDGEPILEPIENSTLMAVVNTPFPMAFNATDKYFYLLGNTTWYRAQAVTGTWKEMAQVPDAVAQLKSETPDTDNSNAVDTQMKIIGATGPTELISTQGSPRLTPFPGNALMYVENTDNDILYEVDTGTYYLLISGRWYKAAALSGPWKNLPPQQLPKSFAGIPADSVKSDLLASVPGTIQSNEAMLDAQIPETAVVERSSTSLTVEYDGDPVFEPIQGTQMDYALNTATPVIRVNNEYYAVDNGIWFVAGNPKGPWTVSTQVPDSVQDIPPSCPVYRIKYVYVYDYTPQVVYVGYTPGYTGCYVHHGVVVYGTGYRYHPWHGRHYYPRPATWGYSVRYSSYHGWSFGVSFSNGPFTFYFGHGWGRPHHRGWWGPPRYRPPYHRPPSHRPPSNRPPSGKPPGNRPSGNGPSAGKPAQLPQGGKGGSLYNKKTGGKGVEGRAVNRPNNVYTDRQGNVHRKTDKGWEQRQGKQWVKPSGGNNSGTANRPTNTPQRPASKPSISDNKQTTRPASRDSLNRSTGNRQQNLQRDAVSRNRGQQRTQQSQRSRQSQPNRSGGGGGRRN